MPLAVFVKRIRHFIKLPFTRIRIPFTESQREYDYFSKTTPLALER